MPAVQWCSHCLLEFTGARTSCPYCGVPFAGQRAATEEDYRRSRRTLSWRRREHRKYVLKRRRETILFWSLVSLVYIATTAVVSLLGIVLSFLHQPSAFLLLLVPTSWLFLSTELIDEDIARPLGSVSSVILVVFCVASLVLTSDSRVFRYVRDVFAIAPPSAYGSALVAAVLLAVYHFARIKLGFQKLDFSKPGDREKGERLKRRLDDALRFAALALIPLVPIAITLIAWGTASGAPEGLRTILLWVAIATAAVFLTTWHSVVLLCTEMSQRVLKLIG